MSAQPLNPLALALVPDAPECAEPSAEPAPSLCDLPDIALQHILRLLASPDDVARCAATCRALRAAARHAALELLIALPLQAGPSATPPVLPSSLLAPRGWLRVARLDLSGAFMAEEQVISALALPQLRHLSLLGCQKVTGDDPALLAALEAAPALVSFSLESCFSLRASAATALLSACLDGRCALRSLVLGSAALHFGDLLPSDTQQRRSKLRLLALPSCELSGMRHAAAALARAPLGALLLSGCALRDEPCADDDEDPEALPDDTAADGAPAEPLSQKQPEPAAVPAPPQRLLVLESTQSAAGAAYCASGADAPVETWDLLRATDAEALAAAGSRRLRARLAAACPAFAAVSAAELGSALAVAASASAPPRRGAPLHAAASRGDAAHVAALLALGGRADARDVAGATPLFVAAEAGAAAACEALLAAGASLETRTTAGEGAAYIAALKGRTDAARVLLAAAEARGLPAEALANIDGWTPLMAAAVAGRAGMLQLCIVARGELDGTSRFGQTALHLAARRGSDELCQLLLQAGASAKVRDERGAAPADVAARHGHAALAAVLRAKTGPSKKERRRAQQRQDAPPAAV